VGRLRELRVSLRKLAWEKAGIVRSGASLRQALDEAAHLDDLIREVRPADLGQRLTREDLLSSSFVLRAILTASLARTESRGCFSRSDYPDEDNDRWLKNSCLSYRVKTSAFSLDHCPASPPVPAPP
jgi:succinate dehydrogenase/fumarate reductase flavoprotein subunit